MDQRADRSTWFGFGGAAEAEVKNSGWRGCPRWSDGGLTGCH
ncbi:hypothetical protein [Enterobacter phage 01_vB_Eclo_IJM]|nr:hypothetical protein [Enterobacter phage 01_vB_Eclo_IJM]